MEGFSGIPGLVILFGLAGAGKSYVARVLAKHFGFFCLEGDDFLTPAMRAAIASNASFTQAMRDELTDILVGELRERLSALPPGCPGVVLSYAFYKKSNRERMRAAFPAATMVAVQANAEIRQARLVERVGEEASRYLVAIERHFESPGADEGIFTLHNERATSDEALLEQCRGFGVLRDAQ